MKTLKYILMAFCVLFAAASCTKNPSVEDGPIVLDGCHFELGNIAGIATRTQVNGTIFAVNENIDPTKTANIATRTGTLADPGDAAGFWEVDLQIYKGNVAYTPNGSGCYYYDAGLSAWTAPYPANGKYKKAYFPNYKKQKITGTVRPADWISETDSPIALDQRDAKTLLVNDILVLTANQTFNPAHTITGIKVEHKYSMFDFILKGVDNAELEEVTVEDVTHGKTYKPYCVKQADAEYMVILPLGIKSAVIHIRTLKGAHYKETIALGGTLQNTAYCALFEGLEMKLSVLSVKDWAYGDSKALHYVSITAYPTMMAWADANIRVFFDNNLSQLLQFNDYTMITVRPAGRTIVKVKNVNNVLVKTDRHDGNGNYYMGTDPDTPVNPLITESDYLIGLSGNVPAEETGAEYDLTAPGSICPPIILKGMTIIDLEQFF